MTDIEKYFGISKRITPWKIDTPFEKYLSDKAGESPLAKEIYASFYEYSNPEYFKYGKQLAFDMIDARPNDFKGVDKEAIYIDMVYCLHKFGFSFEDYCCYNFINRDDDQRVEFISDKLRYHYCDLLNAPFIEELMTDKYQCFLAYKEFYKRDILKISGECDFNAFKLFCNKHSKFIYKPLFEHSGHGVSFVDSEIVDPEEWFNKIISSPGVVEELIIQGDELNVMYPHSINSCRIVTFTDNSEVTIIGGTLRMGCGGNVVDNAGAGGIYASIDIGTGILQSDAQNYHNQHYINHPDTNVPIKGFKLPGWEGAIELINKMARKCEGATLIAWDIAYSDNGWVMVEANDNGAWIIIQSNLQTGVRSRLFKLMDKFFESQNGGGNHQVISRLPVEDWIVGARRRYAERVLANKSSVRKSLTGSQKLMVDSFWNGYGRNASKLFDLGQYEVYNRYKDPNTPLELFIPDDFYYCYADLYFTDYHTSIKFDNKNLYDLYFFDVHRPESLGRNINGILMDSDYSQISVESLLRKCSEARSVIIKKTLNSDGGHGIAFFDDCNLKSDDIMTYLSENRDFIIQRVVKQHPDIAIFNPESVNTVRIMTLFFNNTVHVLSSVLRMGINGSRVDNASSGGIVCGINDDGSLKKYAYDSVANRYECHPQGMSFDGHVIPSFDKCVEICKSLSLRFVNISRLISWDLSIDTNGMPLLIEANFTGGQLDFHQLCNGPIWGSMTKNVLDEIFLHSKGVKTILNYYDGICKQ